MAAAPIAPRRSHRAAPEREVVGDSSSRYVSTVSGCRGCCRRSGAGTQRLMNANVSELHSGHLCAS